VRRIALLVLACAGWIGGARPVAAQEQIVVRVVTDPERLPLGYAVVSAPDLGLERFVGPTGVVALQVPLPGRVLLRVKRLGFTARDTVVTVATGTPLQVTVALGRFSYRLPAVRVVEVPPCRRPGLRADTDPAVRGVVDQLRQNAERYRLLAESFPFVYRSERIFRRQVALGTPQLERGDTLLVDGSPSAWRYAPGAVVSRERAPSDGERRWVMHLPQLSDLADEAFIDAHCFHVMGEELKEGVSLLRVEVRVAERIRGADVDLTVWLDPRDFQLRYANFRLTNFSRQFPTLVEVESAVSYTEVAPFIPVMYETRARNVDGRGRPEARRTVFHEHQRILELTFLQDRPPGVPGAERP
jgi:hypothetical protein